MMDKTVAYVTNEHPYYLRMILNSASMLRRHNRTVPVRVFLVRDGSSQTIERENVSRSACGTGEAVDMFLRGCEGIGVEVIEKPPLVYPGEETFFHVNRMYMGELAEDRVLYLDADTFVFGDVESLFDRYRGVGLAACRADWALARGYDLNFLPVPVVPFSSGVMVWNFGEVRWWCERLPGYLADLRTGDGPLSRWLYVQHPDCLLREEFSVSKHVSEQGLSFDYIRREDCHLVKSDDDIQAIGESTVFHCYTPNWKKCCRRLAGKPPKRIAPGGIKVRRPGGQARATPLR